MLELKDATDEELLILSRFLYKIGEPYFKEDAPYEDLLQKVGGEYLNRSYDDDEIPIDLLKKFNMEDKIPNDLAGTSNPYYSYLDAEKSLSINSVTSYRLAFDFCCKNRGKDLVLSLKIDGVNCKSLFIELLKLSLSRARAGLGFDFTKTIGNAIPKRIPLNQEVIVYSESFVPEIALEYLRRKYGKPYKTPKAGAISMLRVEHEESDYQYLKSVAFFAEGLSDTLSGTLMKLKEMGFVTVPHVLIKGEDIPSDYEEFCRWLKEYMDAFYTQCKSVPSDGLVLQVNDLKEEFNISGQYSEKNIALKFEHWTFSVYKAKVKDIVMELRGSRYSCKVKIEPMKTDDMCEARIVNVHNQDILIRENALPGEYIYFERNSGAVNILVPKEEVKKRGLIL